MQPKFKQGSKVLAHWLKTDTNFTGNMTNVSDKVFYSVKFDDGDVNTGIEECDKEIYGSKEIESTGIGEIFTESGSAYLGLCYGW